MSASGLPSSPGFADYWALRIRAYRLLGLPCVSSDDQLLLFVRFRRGADLKHLRALDSTLPNWREDGSIGIGRWRWVVAELEQLLAEDDHDGEGPHDV